MRWFMRPDAALALEEEGVKKALGRYTRVTRDKLPASFLIARSVGVEFGEHGDWWEIHKKAMEEFRDKKEEMGEGYHDFESLESAETSLLDLKVALAQEMLKSCTLCERRCGVNRLEGEKGFCGAGKEARLSSEFLHMGEEACLVPSHTFFFIGCTLNCVYCQNWRISRRVEGGRPVTGEEMARTARVKRVAEGSRNINLVGGEPTPNLHPVLEMLTHLDVNVPVVWNSNMYMSEEAMALLEGAVDVYLTDFKYGNDACAERLSRVKAYTTIVKRNHLLATQQAEVLIRHLVLPNHLECCTFEVLKWIAENFGDRVRVNIMGQYRPEYQAARYPEIGRGVGQEEMLRALEKAKELNLTNID